MSVVVDTSVWSLLYRKKGPVDHDKVRILTHLLSGFEDVALTGVILQEILQAFRSQADFQRITRYFGPFQVLPLDRSDYIEAARLHRRCTSAGVAATTIDCQIAIASIRNDCLLLTADKDFERIAKHCDLKLL